jgi:hypothetical protein
MSKKPSVLATLSVKDLDALRLYGESTATAALSLKVGKPRQQRK